MGKNLQGEINRQRIKLAIADYGSEGTFLKQIVDKVKPLHKTVVIDHLKVLINNGEVTKGPHKRDKYVLNYTDANVGAYLLGKHGLIDIFHKKGRQFTYSTISQFLDELKNKKTKKGKIQLNESESMTLSLLELTNKIGAFIIYSLIRGMNPDNELINSTDYVDRDELVKQWVNSSVSYLWGFLLLKCIDFIFDHVFECARSPFIIDNKGLKGQRLLFGLDRTTIRQMLRSHARIYPHIHRGLENIMLNLSKETKAWREDEKTVVKILACKNHQFELKVEKTKKIKKCGKCGEIKVERIISR